MGSTTTTTATLDPDLIDRAADRVEAAWYPGPRRHRPYTGQTCECAFTAIAVEVLEQIDPEDQVARDELENDYLKLFSILWDLPPHLSESGTPYHHMRVFAWNDAQPNGRVVADAMRDAATYLRRVRR